MRFFSYARSDPALIVGRLLTPVSLRPASFPLYTVRIGASGDPPPLDVTRELPIRILCLPPKHYDSMPNN
jgi:hypothetical protein